RLKLDDPVGALSVHLVNGVFGTLCVGLFAQDKLTGTATGNGMFFGGGTKLLMAQSAGVLATGAFVFTISLFMWMLIKATIGLRVSLHEEIEGLDIGEHGNSAYPEFLNRKPAYSFSGIGKERP
ncbi:MAG: ammonia permease, partial [Candidatus Omnitrophica bacterium]|nr:ammonia permease [Candidatus Omnitrophota bacterium]